MVNFFRRYHKWIGLFFSFFIVMFAFSGIVLNHRHLFSKLDVSRSILPKDYRLKNWNNGAVKGSFKLSPDTILLYGGSGIWMTDSLHTSVSPFLNGFKKGADNKMVSNIVRTSDGNIYATSTFDLYKLNEATGWENITQQAGVKERISDLAVNGDTLVLLSRSHLYLAVCPFNQFICKELPAPEGYQAGASLFRTLWLLHSGELFGLPGKIVVDGIGLLLIVLCVTGILFTFCPGIIKRKKKKGLPTNTTGKTMKYSIKWHNKIGAICLIFFLITSISGMFLRPPLMIAIIKTNVKAIPGTVLNKDNPWHDKLRCIRYDALYNDWILYSSSGFYTLENLSAIPVKLKNAPPVSVMGVTAMKPTEVGWMVGSFSGLYHWERESGKVVDFHTGKPVIGRPTGRPIAPNPVSGYVDDFADKKVVFDYNSGATVFESEEGFVSMPIEVAKTKMSLWHVCLEIHVGRAYRPFLGPFSELFVFISGLLLCFILISGYVVYRKRYRKKKSVKG